MKNKTEPLTEIIPLRVSKTMLRELQCEATEKLLAMATYVRQVIDRRNGKK